MFVYGVVRLLILESLTLEKIVDTAYFCGVNQTPVFIIIATPPGAGKTWSTSALTDTDFVQYINKPYSPNEHRKIITNHASRTRLLINDDLSLTSRWNQMEYYSTFCMIADGEILFTQWKSTTQARMNCSLVLCCTLDYYYANHDNMISGGMLDRLVPIVLGLSNDTRKKYQKYIQNANVYDNKAPKRDPTFADIKIVKKELLSKKDINPRLLMNIKRMSQFLTEDETDELIAVAHSNGKFEV